MHEDLLCKTLGRTTVLKLNPAEFQQAKEADYSSRLHKQ